MPEPHERRTMIAAEPDRLRQISQRLEDGFYGQAPAAERIAAAVLAEVRNLDQDAPVVPR
jgi:hypothetical protein